MDGLGWVFFSGFFLGGVFGGVIIVVVAVVVCLRRGMLGLVVGRIILTVFMCIVLAVRE